MKFSWFQLCCIILENPCEWRVITCMHHFEHVVWVIFFLLSTIIIWLYQNNISEPEPGLMISSSQICRKVNVIYIDMVRILISSNRPISYQQPHSRFPSSSVIITIEKLRHHSVRRGWKISLFSKLWSHRRHQGSHTFSRCVVKESFFSYDSVIAL